MHSGTPKIKLGIAPGTSARKAEQERQAEDVPQMKRIQPGTAARIAEAEKQVSVQRPFSIQVQGRVGKPYARFDSSIEEPVQSDARNEVPLANSTEKNAENVSSANHPSLKLVTGRNQARNTADSKRVLPFGRDKNIDQDKNKKESPTSPFKRLRALFSRSLPNSGTS
jgi:hypothetical protein